MNESGVRAVFLAERPKLLRLLVARLGNADDAEDILQEVWLKLHGAGVGPVASPTAYLFRIAHNLAIDRRRAEAWRQARETSWMQSQPGAEECPDAAAALLARERLAHVELALANLPDRVGRAFRLYRLENMPQKAIAAEMGISLSLVEKLLQQAYRRIHDAGRENDAGLPGRPRLFSKEDRT